MSIVVALAFSGSRANAAMATARLPTSYVNGTVTFNNSVAPIYSSEQQGSLGVSVSFADALASSLQDTGYTDSSGQYSIGLYNTDSYLAILGYDNPDEASSSSSVPNEFLLTSNSPLINATDSNQVLDFSFSTADLGITVQDGAGNPVSDATITVTQTGPGQVADADGNTYAATNVSASTTATSGGTASVSLFTGLSYEVCASTADGGGPYCTDTGGAFTAGESVTVNLPVTYTVQGRLTFGGAPANALSSSISLTSTASLYAGSSGLGSDGSYVIVNVPDAASYYANISYQSDGTSEEPVPDAFSAQSVNPVVQVSGGDLTYNFDFPIVTDNVTVLNPDGTPASDVTVEYAQQRDGTVTDSTGQPYGLSGATGSAQTGPDGTVTLGMIPGLQYQICAYNGVYVSCAGSLVSPASDTSAQIQLGDNLSGQITFNGQPAPLDSTTGNAGKLGNIQHVYGVSINLTDDASCSEYFPFACNSDPDPITDASGDFAIPVLPTIADYTAELSYYATGYNDSSTSGVPDEFNLTTPVNFSGSNLTLSPDFATVPVTVSVVDNNGSPAPGVTVSATAASGTVHAADGTAYSASEIYSQASTDSTGSATFSVFPGVTYDICAETCETAEVTGPATFSFGPVIGSPAGLAAQSPTSQPVLTWNAVPGAISYNIYRDGTDIGTSTTTSYTDTAAGQGTYSYYVTATNGTAESSPSNSVTVMVGTAPAFTSAAATSTGMLVPFSFQVTTTGNPAASLTQTGALPAGVTFTDNGDGTGTFSGQAAAGTSGSYPVTITASNGIGSPVTQPFTLTVTSATSVPALTSSASATETFGVPFTFTITTTGYPAPAISKTGALPPGVTFTDNGNGTATLTGTPSQSAVGTYPTTLKAKNSTGTTTQAFVLTITKAPVFKALPATSTTTTGTAYALTIKTSGYTTPALTETGQLPTGLTFTDNGNGTATLTGTPAPGTGGSYPLTITATNQLGSSTAALTLKIDQSPAITSSATATATIGQAFAFQITATGYPAPALTKTGTLPKGLTWNAAAGTITGTPTAKTTGTYPLTLTARNNTSTATQTFTLTVN